MKKHTEELKPLIKIGKVTIYTNEAGNYLCFKSDLDVCTDGTGPSHGDDYHLNQTAYTPSLNADKDQYIVVPPQVRTMVEPVVMGCQARLTRISTKKSEPAVMGEIGPDDKTGEAAICLAQKMNSAVSANVGDSKHDYFYELWPGVPAVVHGKKYKLQPC